MNTQEILKHLVSINTEHHNSTLDAVLWIKDYLKHYGIESNLIFKDYNNQVDNNRASLVATIGKYRNPGVVFSGHLDTVAANKSGDWIESPFKLHEIDDELYGLGTVDMKGSIASILSLTPHLKKSGKTFHLVFTHDEEGGFTAIRQLVDNNFYNLFDPKQQKAAVIMEGTTLEPVIAHTGNKRMKIFVKGKSYHACHCDRAVDALSAANEIYTFMRKTFNNRKPCENALFNPPRSQLNIGFLTGGGSDYFVPGEAELSFSIRYIPNDDIQPYLNSVSEYALKKVLPELRAQDENTDIRITETSHVIPFETSRSLTFMRTLGSIINSEFPEIKPKAVSYATEAGFFKKAGIPCVVVWGPGDNRYAHKVNEHISKTQLMTYSMMLNKLIERC